MGYQRSPNTHDTSKLEYHSARVMTYGYNEDVSAMVLSATTCTTTWRYYPLSVTPHMGMPLPKSLSGRIPLI